MQIYDSVTAYSGAKNSVVTVGTFDGVHVGHRKILNMLKDIALRIDGQVVVLTFHPHPRKVLFPDQPPPRLLSTPDEKAALLSELGVDHLVFQPFTEAFRNLQYDEFVRDILVKQLSVQTLVIGYDHQFGKDRQGNIAGLRKMGAEYNFNVLEIPEQDIRDAAVSSTRIRKALESGNVTLATELLGYNYSLKGKVVHGHKLGRSLGYPTANLQTDDSDKLIPSLGIYAVRVEVKGQMYGGMLSIGTRPTFDDGEVSVEVNIFDFEGDIYDEIITLHFVSHIRDELKFDSVDALVDRIGQDKKDSLRILSYTGKH